MSLREVARSNVRSAIRRGTYLDSVVLMQIQHALSIEPGVFEAGVMMALPSNLELLDQRGLLTAEMAQARADDLLISVAAETSELAEAAIDRFDALLAERRPKSGSGYRPKSLEGAFSQAPEARWVSISVPGRWAADVADRALDAGRHVFLYSDNVSLDDEVRLKRKAAERGLLVMGPDCGTAIVGGVGLGFANRVRRGSIGLVGASGTGLQAITTRIHSLGAGVSHALGTGGRDLSERVGGVSALQALDLLARDDNTEVIVLVSKPPDARVAGHLLSSALASRKPVIVAFLGYSPPGRSIGSLTFATSMDEAAELAVGHLSPVNRSSTTEKARPDRRATSRRWLRGLFSGGTLATDVSNRLRPFLGEFGQGGHAIVDLGGDEYTLGRPHPMIDNGLRLERLAEEADDTTVAIILLDVVLGDGAHPDPSAELAPAIARARETSGGELDVAILLVGTEDDPQDLVGQKERLEAAGARVFRTVDETVLSVLDGFSEPSTDRLPPVSSEALAEAPKIINVGVESFYDSLIAQEARAIQVDWRPPAGGDERLVSILDRLRGPRPASEKEAIEGEAMP